MRGVSGDYRVWSWFCLIEGLFVSLRIDSNQFSGFGLYRFS